MSARASQVFSTSTVPIRKITHFGPIAELSGYIGSSAEVYYGHFGTKEDTSAPANTDQAMSPVYSISS